MPMTASHNEVLDRSRCVMHNPKSQTTYAQNPVTSRVSSCPEAFPVAQWSPEQREIALGLLRAGNALADVHRRTEIPKQTLSRWAHEADIHPPGAEQAEAAANATRIVWAKRREQLIDRFGDVAAALLDRLEDSSAQDVRHLVWSAAVSVDKAQLLSGGVTSRHEQLDAQRRRGRVEEIADELSQRRAAKDGTTGG